MLQYKLCCRVQSSTCCNHHGKPPNRVCHTPKGAAEKPKQTPKQHATLRLAAAFLAPSPQPQAEKALAGFTGSHQAHCKQLSQPRVRHKAPTASEGRGNVRRSGCVVRRETQKATPGLYDWASGQKRPKEESTMYIYMPQGSNIRAKAKLPRHRFVDCTKSNMPCSTRNAAAGMMPKHC